MKGSTIAYKPIGVIRSDTRHNGWQDEVDLETAQRRGQRRETR